MVEYNVQHEIENETVKCTYVNVTCNVLYEMSQMSFSYLI